MYNLYIFLFRKVFKVFLCAVYMPEDDFEIIDPESYAGEKETAFSHQELVMKTMRRTIDIRSHELTKGANILQQDNRGKWIMVHKEDMREAYFGSIRLLIELMKCDFDTTAKTNIEKLEGELGKVDGKKLKEQKEMWDKASELEKISLRTKYGVIDDKRYNPELPFLEESIQEKIIICDKIFGELNQLTRRINFYEEEALMV